MATVAAPDPTLEAYDALAPYYDLYTASYEHERWLAQLEAIALELGLAGRRLLDVGCGTGKSCLPLLARGYDVVACDASPGMVERARKRLAPLGAQLVVADMRDLPPLGSFDLATCLDDGLNYLLDSEDLRAALGGLARSLRPGGLLVFDLNTLSTYRTHFAAESVEEVDGARFRWHGHADPAMEAGGLARAVLEVFSSEEGDRWRHVTTTHLQRHHPPEAVHSALEESGLELLEVRGQSTGARLERAVDEARHTKLVYFARRPVESFSAFERANRG